MPKEHVVKVWEKLVLPVFPENEETDWDVDNEDVNDFLDYLEKTWIGALNQRTGQRRNPKFKHELWNKYQAVLDEDPTTTNSSEGYNNAIQLSIPRNANVFSIIKQFITEDSLVEIKLRDAAIGSDPEEGRSRKKDWFQRQEDLKHLVGN